MFYRFTCDLSFKDPQAPNQLKGLATALIQHAVIINSGDMTEEIGYIRLHECYHDEDPNKPCKLLFESLVE